MRLNAAWLHGHKVMRVLRESWIILAIGMLDLTTTLIWVAQRGAQEANPIFRYYLELGPLWFIAMKFVCLLCPILIFEWARKHRPKVVLYGARFAIAGYLLLYLVGIARLNPHMMADPEYPSVAMGTMGPVWGEGHIAIAEHTFRLPMTASDSSYPAEGLR